MIDRKRTSERMMLKIVLRHQDTLIQDHMTAKKMQDDINKAIEDFILKTGRRVKQISVEKIDGKFKLLLEVQ